MYCFAGEDEFVREVEELVGNYQMAGVLDPVHPYASTKHGILCVSFPAKAIKQHESDIYIHYLHWQQRFPAFTQHGGFQ